MLSEVKDLCSSSCSVGTNETAEILRFAQDDSRMSAARNLTHGPRPCLTPSL
jgi:hypothetical protein